MLLPSRPIHSSVHSFTWGGRDHKELTPLSPHSPKLTMRSVVKDIALRSAQEP